MRTVWIFLLLLKATVAVETAGEWVAIRWDAARSWVVALWRKAIVWLTLALWDAYGWMADLFRKDE